MKKRLLLLLITAFAVCWQVNAQGPVDCYGMLQVQGNKIVGSRTGSQSVQVKGISLGWNHYPESGPFFTANMVDAMVKQWKAEVVRAPMAAVSDQWDNKGYDQNAAALTSKNDAVIKRAIDLGVYVVIDWHSHHAESAAEKGNAKKYMLEMAEKWGSYENVIFEIYNEPLGSGASWNGITTSTTWNDIKAYANEMIEAIRNVTAKGSGPNAGKKVQNLIIVGTRRWSQELIEATGSNSIGNEDNKNIAYGFHFYAGGSHPCNGGPANVYSGHPLCASTDNWQITMEDQLKGAMNNNKAVFVTEWGTVGSSGNNAHNANSSDAWHKLLDQYKISSCAWQWGGKDETSAFFLDKAAWNKPPTTPNQPESWFGVKSNFSESGQYIFQMLQNWANVASWRQSNACGDCEPIAVIYKYNYAGAPADGTSTACKGQKVSEPAKPTRAGYQFSGWFTADEGGEEFNFDTEITTATTIYAQWSEGEGSTMIADCKSDKTNLCTTWWSYLDKEAGGSTLTAVGGTDEDEDGNISLKVSENGGFNNGPCMSVNFASPAQGAWPNADYSIWGAGLGFNLDAASTEKVPVVVDLTNAISISFRYDTDANSISNKKNFIELKVNGRAENLIAEIIPPTTKWGVVDIPFESFATSQYAEIEEPSDPINATDMKNIIAIQFKIEAEEAAKSISMGISDIQINGKDLSAITNTCKGDGVGVATIENVSFAIYPNPAKAGNFNVTLADSDAANLTILNLQGQVVYSAAVNNGAAAINANLGVGVYVVSVQTANGVQTQKLVVK